MSVGALGKGLRRDVGRRRRIEVSGRHVDDVGRVSGARHIGVAWVFQHAAISCNDPAGARFS